MIDCDDIADVVPLVVKGLTGDLWRVLNLGGGSIPDASRTVIKLAGKAASG